MRKKKVMEAIIPSLLLVFTFCICAPLQMYLTNITEMWFSINDIWWMCVLVGVAIFGVCIQFYSIL